MNVRKLIGFFAMSILLASGALAAGNFRIQYPLGTDLFVVDTVGNTNVTGQIAENNKWLYNIYLNATDNATLVTYINQQNTTMTAYVDGQGFLTVTDNTTLVTYINQQNTTMTAYVDANVQADTLWNITDSKYLVNLTSGTEYYLDVNETVLNTTIDAKLTSDGYVQKIGDDMTGNLNMLTGANINVTDGFKLMHKNGTNIEFQADEDLLINASGDVIILLDP